MNRANCPGQDSRFLKAQDITETRCPQCGRAVEFWPDEIVRKCSGCDARLVNPKSSLKCLAWCRHAAQCLAAIRGKGAATIGPPQAAARLRGRERAHAKQQAPQEKE